MYRRHAITMLSCIALFAAVLPRAETARAQQAEMATTGYTATVTAQNLQARFYVNGAPLFLHGRFDPIQATVPITEMLQPGENVITVDYEPFDMEKRAFTPHDGVALQVGLRRQGTDASPPVDDRITLFSGRYDPAQGQMVASDKSVFGQGDLLRAAGDFRAGSADIAPVQMRYSNRVSDGQAMRLRLSFTIGDSPMPAPPWLAAPELADTPQLRDELAREYRKLHEMIARKDETAFRQEMQLVHAHLAPILGYADADAVARAIRARIPLGPPEGATLAPLPADLERGQLEFGSDGRMVRLISDPIRFVDAAGDNVGGHSFFFCRKGARLRICFVQDIPY